MSNAKADINDTTLTIAEVAKRLNCSKPKVYRLINTDPDFRTFTLGGTNKARRMRASALAAWINKQEEKERAA